MAILGGYMGFNDFWHNLMVKLHLNGLTDKIDKYFPSWLLFLIIIAIIIGIIIYLSLPNETNVTFQFYSDSSLVKDNLDVTFTINTQAIRKTTTTGSIELKKVKNGSKVNVRLDNLKYSINKDFVISTNLIKVNLEKKSTEEEQAPEFVRTAIVLKDADKRAYVTPTPAKLTCPDETSNTVMVTGGMYVFEKDTSCNPLRINIDVNGFVSVNKTCTQTTCEIQMQRLGEDPNNFGGKIETNSLTVYVKNFSDGLVGDAKVELLDFVNVSNVIDYRQTNAMGYTQFTDLARGKYKLRATKDMYSKTVDVEITAGSPITSTIKFDKQAIGSIKLNVVSEDKGECKGRLYYNLAGGNPIGSYDVNCNAIQEVAIYEKGIYQFDLALLTEYEEKYMAINDFNVNYDQNSGVKNSTLTVEKINIQLATRLNVTVLSEELIPLPNVDVYLRDALTKNISLGYGTKTTDADGKTTFPAIYKGTYEIIASNDYFDNTDNTAPFVATDHKGLEEIYEEDVNVFVELGKVTFIVTAVDEFGVALGDYNISIYKNGEFVGSRKVGKVENTDEPYEEVIANIYPAYNSYRIVVQKEGFMPYQTSDVFLPKGEEYPVDARLSNMADHSGPATVEFLGVFNSARLLESEKAEVLDVGSEYYYGFSVIVPLDAASKIVTEGDGYHYFNSVVGNPYVPEETEDALKLYIKDAGGNSTYYQQFMIGAEFANDDPELRRAKHSVTKTKIDGPTSYEVAVKVQIRSEAYVKAGDELIFSYIVKDSNILPGPNELSREIYYAGVQFLCDISAGSGDFCITAYYNGNAYNTGNLEIQPGWTDVNYSVILKDTINDATFVHYASGSPVETIGGLKDLPMSELYYQNQKINYYKDGVSSNLYTNNDLNGGPVYYSSEESDFWSNDKIEFIQQLKLMEGTEGQNLQFHFFQPSESKVANFIISFSPDHKIIVEGLPGNNYLVPEIENKLTLTFKTEEDVPLNTADLRLTYRVKSIGSNNYEIQFSKNVRYGEEFTLPPQPEDTNIRLDFEAIEGENIYAPAIVYMTYTTDLFEIGSESENTIEVRVPSTPSLVSDANFKLINRSPVEFAISGIEIVPGDSDDSIYFENAIDWEKLKKFFLETGLKIAPNSEQERMNFSFEYKPDNLVGLSLGPLPVNFLLILTPVNSTEEYSISLDPVPFVFNFVYDNAPEQAVEDCLKFELKNADNDDLDAGKLVFLESLQETFYVNISNTCISKSGLHNYKFDKLGLIVSRDTTEIPLSLTLTCVYGCNKETGVDDFESQGNNLSEETEFLLKNARHNREGSVYGYRYKAELKLDVGTNVEEIMEIINNEEDKLTFTLKPYYDPEMSTGDDSMPEESFDISVKKYSDCINLQLNEEETQTKIVEKDSEGLIPVYHDKDSFFDSLYYVTVDGVKDPNFIRMPYEFETYRNDELSWGEKQGTYLLENLPLDLNNECGKPISYYVILKQGTDIVDGTNGYSGKKKIEGKKLRDSDNGYINVDEKQPFTLIREDYRSGALRIQLYNANNDSLLDELYVNVQSTSDNLNFMVDPFVNSESGLVGKVFSNDIRFFEDGADVFVHLWDTSDPILWDYENRNPDYDSGDAEYYYDNDGYDLFFNVPYFSMLLSIMSQGDGSSDRGIFQFYYACDNGTCEEEGEEDTFVSWAKKKSSNILEREYGFMHLGDEYNLATNYDIDNEKGVVLGYALTLDTFTGLKKYSSISRDNIINVSGEQGGECWLNNINRLVCGSDVSDDIIFAPLYPILLEQFRVSSLERGDQGLARFGKDCYKEDAESCVMPLNESNNSLWSKESGWFDRLFDKQQDLFNSLQESSSPISYYYIMGYNGVSLESPDYEASKLVFKCTDGYDLISVEAKHDTSYNDQDDGLCDNEDCWKTSFAKGSYDESNELYYIINGIAMSDTKKNPYYGSFVAGAGYCVKSEVAGCYRFGQAWDIGWSVIVDYSPLKQTSILMNVPSCMAGGITGESVTPKINYDNPKCELKDGEDYTVCDVSQFAIWLISKISEDGAYDVALMSDSYNKEVLQLINRQFLSQYEEFEMLNYNGEKIVGKLPQGVYHIEIRAEKVYLWYLHALAVNHIFYKMPYDGGLNVGTSIENAYGTITDNILAIDFDKQFLYTGGAEDNAKNKTPAYSYTVEDQEGTNLPYIFKAVEAESGGSIYWNGPSGINEKGSCIRVEDITNEISPDYTKNVDNTNYWNVFVVRDEEVYPYPAFLNVIKNSNDTINIEDKALRENDVVYFVRSNKCIIDNSGNKVYTCANDDLDCVTNLIQLYNKFDDERVCYRMNGNIHEYYWNITPSILEELTND